MPTFLSGVAVDIVVGVAGFLFSLLTYATALQGFQVFKKKISSISKILPHLVILSIFTLQFWGSASALFAKGGLMNLSVNSMRKTAESLLTNEAFLYAALAATIVSLTTSIYSFYSARHEFKRKNQTKARPPFPP